MLNGNAMKNDAIRGKSERMSQRMAVQSKAKYNVENLFLND